ncbi:cilia- and flagella-associated protein 45-like [Rhopilema esculentum]|uniref:cilia- and flagella-associated protein 45-like n=1 Tax=Rhopilema esculentum TaxID=499914 RepID=UPI0031D88659
MATTREISAKPQSGIKAERRKTFCLVLVKTRTTTRNMPSASSVASGDTASSSGSRRRYNPKYNVVSRNSSVDEALFGNGRRVRSAPEEKGLQLDFLTGRSNSATGRPSRRAKKGEVIEVITKDMIRKLKVPDSDPSGRSIILNPMEYNRIKNASKVLTAAEREEQIRMYNQQKQRLLDAGEERKNFMQQMERQRKQNEKLSEIEQEAKEQSQYLLEKAQEQMEEEEDEIKKLNELILNAKCHAIRDAQLIEKVDIKKELLDEEKRLDEMMENDRLKALKEYEEREHKKKEERLRGAGVLKKQIEENEMSRLLEQNKKDLETAAMLEYLDKLQTEDMENLIKKREMQHNVMKDVAKANKEIKAIKETRKAQEMMEEVKVMDYLKEKAAREEAYEKEKERQRIEKEKEIARLRAQQERAIDKQAEKDALRAKRNQERLEREWRKKEAEEAAKKASTEEMLKMARQEQVYDKEHFLAVQAARDRAEFERVLSAQRGQAAKEEELENHFQHRRKNYAEDIRTQMREKEKERIQNRNAFFEEGVKLDIEAKERRQKLDAIKQRKLRELKDAGVHDKYVNEVSRRIEAPAPSLANML